MGRPGKFEGCADQEVGERLHEMVGEGFVNDETGDVSDVGWYGLLTDTGIAGAEHVIVSEDSQGFFDYETFETKEAAEVRFAEIVDEIDAALDEDGRAAGVRRA